MMNPSAVFLAAPLLLLAACQASAPATGRYSRRTIDVGIVCRDLAASAAFYRDTLGFQEIQGFTGAAQVTGDSGLCDYQEVPVRQFVLPGEDGDATCLKLMQFSARPAAAPDQAYIHSALGVRYLTLFVPDMNEASRRLGTVGVRFLAKGPVPIPGTALQLGVVKDPDGNFIELVGPAAAR